MLVSARRFAALFLALSALAVLLAACQVPSATGGNTNNAGSIVISTPDTSQITPTPKFPPFTIGAWPSNYSPNNTDTITLYVLCRVQDSTMAGPSTPAPNQTINVNLGSPVGTTYTGQTDSDGLAAIPITINDPYSGTPVVITVTTIYQGQSYMAKTFFTPSPVAQPTATPKPTAEPTSTVGTGPTPQPAGTPPTGGGPGNGGPGNGGGQPPTH